MLDAGTGNLLLVDDVHQLDGVCPFHVDHRPLQRVLSYLVQLGGGGEKWGGGEEREKAYEQTPITHGMTDA